MKKLFTCLIIALFTISDVLSQSQSLSTNNITSNPKSKDDSSISSDVISKKDSGIPLKIQSMSPDIWFDDSPYNHNMHIASDGTYYYAINGGSSTVGQINKFDLSGTFIQTYPILIDGRGLSYNQNDGFLYASLFGGDIVKIIDLAAGTFSTLFTGAMQDGQASFAISPDGNKFYDFANGTLLIHDFVSGAVVNTISGLGYGTGNYGGNAAVAVDTTHIYTWDATLKTVYVYDTAGTFMQTMQLDSGDNGHSLSIANNYLFVSRDANYAVGTWYGYNIYGSPNFISEQQDNFTLSIYPNPTNGKIIIKNNNDCEIEVYNYLGEKILSDKYQNKNQTSYELDFSDSPKGIYFIRIYNGKETLTRKIVVQ